METPNTAHFLGTHARRVRALQSYPRTLQFAAKGDSLYWTSELWRLNYGFATYTLCPWMWVMPDEPLGPLDWE